MRLKDEPEGIDATSVECPTCNAQVGWACSQMHADGYHAKRIDKAVRIRIKTLSNS